MHAALGRELVARDRAEAFLPGAATAVLRRVERYRLDLGDAPVTALALARQQIMELIESHELLLGF